MEWSHRNDCYQRLHFLWNCCHVSLQHHVSLSGFYSFRIKQLASQAGIDLTPDMEKMFCPRCHGIYMPEVANLRIISRKKMKKLQQNKAIKLSIVPCVRANDEKTKNYIRMKCSTCAKVSYYQQCVNSNFRHSKKSQDCSSSISQLKTPNSSDMGESSTSTPSVSRSAKKRSKIRHSLLTSMLKASTSSTPQSSPSLKDFLTPTQ